ncbi:MAG: hypothetical protein AMS21_08320 [Gemmatimonas sp. SG8_38_2]|nr:MAG: hypothetical protein AMS21_08320 [Gemmatimonas sp. SG8_38_2]
MMAARSNGEGQESNHDRRTANDRLKASFKVWLSGGIILATAIHFALLEFFPPLSAADFSFGVTEVYAVDLPPEIDVPPPPEAIARPAVPVVAHTKLEEDITVAPTTFEQNPIETLPPPPTPGATRLADQPTFTPYTVAPRLRDRAHATRVVMRKYPKILQDAGIGGTVVVWAFVDVRGDVKNCKIHTSCGVPKLDQAALEAVREFTFVPALNFDRNVPVWVSIPITFEVKIVS